MITELHRYAKHTLRTISVVFVCLSVCLLITTVSCAKTAAQIEMPFRVWTRGAQIKSTVGARISPQEEILLGVILGDAQTYTRGRYCQCYSLAGSSDAASGYRMPLSPVYMY